MKEEKKKTDQTKTQTDEGHRVIERINKAEEERTNLKETKKVQHELAEKNTQHSNVLSHTSSLDALVDSLIQQW